MNHLLRKTILIAFIVLIILTVILVSPALLSTATWFVGPPPPPELVLKSRAPRVYCHSALLMDNSTGQYLYGKQEYKIRPIASITKLLTILLFLEFDVDWEKEIEMIPSDVRNSSRSNLRAGDVYRVKDLFYASLIASDNRATRALVRSTGISIDSFVVLMNRKADKLGLLTMKVEEVTGLSENNVASAADCAHLLNIVSENELIRKVMRTSIYRFKSLKRKRTLRMVNTNRLLKSRWFVEGGKTGYIVEAGWCFIARVSDWRGNDMTAVVLGANSNSARFSQAVKLFKWGLKELREVEG